MANFETTFKKTAAIEAGYTVDNGGPTYKGIAFNSWKSDALAMKIYAIVKAMQPGRGQVIKNATLDAMIYAWFKKNYWDKIYGDNINNQLLADFIYDFFVNSSSATAIINEAIGVRGRVGFNEATLKQLNDRPAWCYDAIRAARKEKYNSLAKKHPIFKTNGTYRGWLARLDKFPVSINA